MTDPATGLVQRVSGWKLETIIPADPASDREIFSSRIPIRRFDVIGNLSRRAARKRRSGQRSRVDESAEEARVEHDGHFAGARQREQPGLADSERTRFRTIGTRGEDLAASRKELPRIGDSLSVGSETSCRDLTATECDALK